MTTDDVQQQVGEQQDKHEVEMAAVWLGHQHYVQSIVYSNGMEQHDQQHVQQLECTRPTTTSYTQMPHKTTELCCIQFLAVSHVKSSSGDTSNSILLPVRVRTDLGTDSERHPVH